MDFISDHNYGIANAFFERGKVDGALDYYHKAILLNPWNVPLLQYRAYLLRNTKDMQRYYAPVKGDRKLKPGQQPLNDYERVVRDLNFVEKHSPNNSLLYQAYGEFYYNYALYYTRQSEQTSLASQRAEYEEKAVENMELAKKNFKRSLLIDPVNESTYAHLTSIAMMERNPNAAQEWIDAYRRGPEGVVEPEFLERHQHSARLAQMEQTLHQPPFSGWWKPSEK